MRRWTAVLGRGAVAALVLASSPGALQGQASGTPPGVDPLATADPGTTVAPPTDPTAALVPFGPGERLRYNVKLGILNVGDGEMTVAGVDTVRGHPSYRIEVGIRGGIPLARVDDKYTSWLDTRTLVSRRFIRDIHEVRYKSYREWAIYPEERRWERVDEDSEGTMITSLPLDEIAFLYFLRTLPLEVGDTYRLDRYFREDGNPVEIRVLRRETREVPAGTFETLVIQPIIRTSGLFSQGGEAEVYLTDDEHRHLVYLRSKVPVVGSLTLHLEEVVEGVALNPAARRGERPDGW